MGEFLADHTTLQLGGPADQFLTHTDPTTWPDLARAAQGDDKTSFVLGGGSNTLAADTGFPGTVIRMATRGITARPLGRDHVEVVAHAGETLGSLVALTVAEGLSGIEYLGGIPGTVGAAPVHNTGAYGQQISDTLTGITAHDWHLATPSSYTPPTAASATAAASSSPGPDGGPSSPSPCGSPAAASPRP
ncbi:FAD-binding protein [Streptomyces seoulensis]|uniref:FAD-binding protein n=1 Tax=Streptomyces seoulensis TaxID=73044 RepID=UPI0033A52015